MLKAIGKRAGRIGQAHLLDACESGIPYESCNIWFADPPYYDAVPYADLSDFFFCLAETRAPRYVQFYVIPPAGQSANA